MNSVEPPEPQRRKTNDDHGQRDQQIAALIEAIGRLTKDLNQLKGQVNRLTNDKKPATEDEPDPTKPAPWVWFPPPAAAEDNPNGNQDPRATVNNFVTWYNQTFIGVDSGRAKPIPPCWQQHPGLAMEVAALAYSWRAANIGPTAIRDAQQWLHQWRPGHVERLVRDWVPVDCLDGDHRYAGAKPRPDRFTVAERNTQTRERDHQESA